MDSVGFVRDDKRHWIVDVACCRVYTQFAYNGVFGANTVAFWRKRADFIAVLALKSASEAF